MESLSSARSYSKINLGRDHNTKYDTSISKYSHFGSQSNNGDTLVWDHCHKKQCKVHEEK